MGDEYDGYDDDDEVGQRDDDPVTTRTYASIIEAGEKVNFANNDEVLKFHDKFKDHFELKHDNHGTLLHRIVERKPPKEPFIRWLLAQYPQLLVAKKDDELLWPLHKALQKQSWNPVFVEAVLECPDEDTVKKALELTGDKDRNFMHLAIQKELRYTRQFIPKSSEKTFTQADGDGNTPLHMAMGLYVIPGNKPHEQRVSDHLRDILVDTPAQLRHTGREARVERRPATPESDATVAKIDGRQTKNDSEPMEKNNPATKDENYQLKNKDAPSKSREPQVKAEELQTKSNSKAMRNTVAHNLMKINTKLASEVATGPGQLTKRRRELFYLPNVVSSLIEAKSDSMAMRNKAGYTPYQCRLRFLAKEASGLPMDQKADTRRRASTATAEDNTVAEEMKLYALRSMEREEVIKTLYENGKERHIEFDLSSLPRPSISTNYLGRLSRHLKFEDSLQYIALPKLRVEQTSKSGSSHNAVGPVPAVIDKTPIQEKPDRMGLTDSKIVFKWLADNGVKKIIRVIVLDDGDVAHSNEAIEQCLAPFKIEVWDWKKSDICSETIHQAAPDVRVVHLYCTGNNAVLRSWSSGEGLAKLKKLERVHLSIRPGLETSIRRQKDIDAFERDLRMNWAAKNGTQRVLEVDVFKDDQSKSRASEFQSNKATEQKQVWLKHIDAFAEYVLNVPDQVKSDIKVAVIDDGFDGFQDAFTDNVVSGVSFCRYSDTDSLMNAYYVPSGGHGTMMASLICRVCPHAKLYVARLDEYKTSAGKRHITASSAAEAVRWAITKGVHIISMSWTIESSRSASDIMEFHKAVKEAEAKDIIMFCAFSDQGNVSSTDCFPSEFPETLTVGAATALGHPCTWVNKELVQLLLPGEHIIIDANPTSPSKPESGSSMATALAAGLAALLLYITQLVKPDQYEQLRKPKGMRDGLTKVGGTEKYIPAKNVFHLEFRDDPKWRWNSGTNLGKEKMGYLVSRFTE